MTAEHQASPLWDAAPSAIPIMTAALGERRWLVLTGAGVSTDSGIPDYRSPGAPARRPMTIAEFRRTDSARQRYWARAYLGWGALGWGSPGQVEPNATHLILADLERSGRLSGLITQNVDGLHTAAGHNDVVDLHGRLDSVVCLDCGDLSTRQEVQERLRAANPSFEAGRLTHLPDGDVAVDDTADFVVVSCRSCEGPLKPDVVFFGESVPRARVEACQRRVEEAEALVVLGSSLQVYSGRRFVTQAHARGIPIVIVNRGATRADDIATVKIDAGCAEVLAALGT